MTTLKQKSNLKRLAIGKLVGGQWQVTAPKQTHSCRASSKPVALSEIELMDEALTAARQDGFPSFVVRYTDPDDRVGV